MQIPTIIPGSIPADPVAPDSLIGVSRQQSNPARWQGENWDAFVQRLTNKEIAVRLAKSSADAFVSDGGGIAYGLPHGVVLARSTEQISIILKAAQQFKVPVTIRGGGLTTEGESVAYGGLLLDMAGMNKILNINKTALTVRAQAGIFWHLLAEGLRRHKLDYLSAPLNMTASVGGTLGVGGIDINSPKYGCSADQALALQVVTPQGDIVECSEENNSELFERVLLGYGQFGVITEATLKVRPYTPIIMTYYYYGSIRTAIEDLQMLDEGDASDYSGILTMLDKGINLLVAFDSDEKEAEFNKTWKKRLRGHGELGFGLRMAFYYALRPWKIKEAFYLLGRKNALMPEFEPAHHMQGEKIDDRTVVFSRAVWKFWGGQQMVIPDLATRKEKFIEAVERGTTVCKKYFPHFTLYCVGIRLSGPKDRYELSCIPPDADFNGIAYGCEFEPMIKGQTYSRDTLQAFKNEIYDIGLDMKTSYYRFGGNMKGYIRQSHGDAMVDKHLALKRKADPAMILNTQVIF